MKNGMNHSFIKTELLRSPVGFGTATQSSFALTFNSKNSQIGLEDSHFGLGYSQFDLLK